jgi:molecular chaperone DnaK
LVYSIERSLKDVDGKVDADKRAEIEEALKNTKEALANDDIEEMKRQQEVLLSASHALSEALYQQAQQQQGAADAAGPDGSPDGDVVEDAEIVDEDDQDQDKR